MFQQNDVATRGAEKATECECDSRYSLVLCSVAAAPQTLVTALPPFTRPGHFKDALMNGFQ